VLARPTREKKATALGHETAKEVSIKRNLRRAVGKCFNKNGGERSKILDDRENRL